MDPALILVELGAVLLVAALAGAACRRLALPAVIGYLAVGLSVGPFTPGYVADPTQIQLLANVGAVLLLFEVGLDTDVRALLHAGRLLLAVVALQVVLSVVVAMAVLVPAGLSPEAAAVIGVALATSSTVVAVNITRSRRRTIDPASGRTMVLWSVIQDLLSIPAIALLGAAAVAGATADLLIVVLRVAVFTALAALVGVVVVPAILHRVADEPDTFLVVVVATALVTAAAGALLFGVPLALAAFIAGLAIRYRRETGEARREILPFRDLFAILFFVAIGTLIEPAALLRDGIWIVVALLVAVKGAIIWALAAATRIAPRPLQLSLGLAQVGEFSFVVLSLGLAIGIVGQTQYSAVLAVAVASIAFSTVAARWPGRHPAVARA